MVILVLVWCLCPQTLPINREQVVSKSQLLVPSESIDRMILKELKGMDSAVVAKRVPPASNVYRQRLAGL